MKQCFDDLDSGKRVRSRFFDLTKAFNTVSHSILLNKLEFNDFNTPSVNLIKSYLTNRFQAVSLKEKISDFRKANHGVLQGSIVGPVLFIIYINDLPSSVCDEYPSIYLFPDDLAISLADTSENLLVSKLDLITSKVIEWCDANKLSLNNDKTVDLNYDLSRKSYDPDEGVKFLGIHLEPGLGWLSHVNCIVAKVSKSLFALRILRHTLGLSSLITAYYAFVHSHLNYGILIWGNHPSTGKLLILQKRAVRITDGASSRCHSRPLFIKYSILTLPSMYVLSCLLYARTTWVILQRMAIAMIT
ncbi:hypothetical protein C0J52_07615 [Blattella germanica]|nr:hypothetical protein C0J52_07615 [Blattella germanica]